MSGWISFNLGKFLPFWEPRTVDACSFDFVHVEFGVCICAHAPYQCMHGLFHYFAQCLEHRVVINISPLQRTPQILLCFYNELEDHKFEAEKPETEFRLNRRDSQENTNSMNTPRKK